MMRMNTTSRRTRRVGPHHVLGRPPSHRGLALVELLMAIAITSMVTAAVASLTAAVARSQEWENDRREATVRAQAMNVRLSGYVTPSRCVLNQQTDAFVVWFDDSRESDTVHVSEIRWFDFDDINEVLELSYTKWPEGWSQSEIDEYDVQFPIGSDWWAVLQTYVGLGFIEKTKISDRVIAFTVSRDAGTEKGKKIMTFNATIGGDNFDHDVVTSSSIREYQEPES